MQRPNRKVLQGLADDPSLLQTGTRVRTQRLRTQRLRQRHQITRGGCSRLGDRAGQHVSQVLTGVPTWIGGLQRRRGASGQVSACAAKALPRGVAVTGPSGSFNRDTNRKVMWELEGTAQMYVR